MNFPFMLTSIFDFLKKDNFKFLYIIILVLSVLCLIYTYVLEYAFHIKPCPLCIYQRFPYLYLIKLSATGLFLKKYSRSILFFIIVTLVIACLLAGYHTGIERKFFESSPFCTTKIFIPPDLNVSEFKEIISDNPVSNCSEIGYKLFGLSLTEYNFILNISLLILVLALFFSN